MVSPGADAAGGEGEVLRSEEVVGDGVMIQFQTGPLTDKGLHMPALKLWPQAQTRHCLYRSS